MTNKVLVTVLCPTIEVTFSVWIPIDKKIGIVKQLIEKGITESHYNEFKTIGSSIYNKDTSMEYNTSEIVKNTDIRNGTRLILI